MALIATRPGARQSRVLFQQQGQEPIEVARISHLPDAEVRGALRGRTVLAIADIDPSGDGSFGAALIRIEEGALPVVLTDRCVHASRPWITPNGHVLVQRGLAGLLPPPGTRGRDELRNDDLSVDDVDPETGKTRTILEFHGYIAHLAAVTEKEAVVYRVSHHHADLVATKLDSGELRVLAAEMPAFARDFSLDLATQSLLFTNRDQDGWVVVRLPLSGGVPAPTTRARGPWAKPAAWPRGGLLSSDESGGEVHGGPGPRRALGPGFDALGLVSPDGQWAVLVHEQPGRFAQPFWVELSSSSVHPISIPSGARVDIAGALP